MLEILIKPFALLSEEKRSPLPSMVEQWSLGNIGGGKSGVWGVKETSSVASN